jgi:hypothetical protein
MQSFRRLCVDHAAENIAMAAENVELDQTNSTQPL